MQSALTRRKSFTFDQGIGYVFKFNAGIAVVVVFAIILFLLAQSRNFFAEYPPWALLGTEWTPYLDEAPKFGIIPLMMSSMWVVVTSMSFALPAGLCAALYISEIAGPKEQAFLKNFVEILASLPSVVLGFFALIVITPLVQAAFGLGSGLTLFSASIVLAIMALPTIITVSEDAIRNVPATYKRASLALGAGRLETLLRVTLPTARNGVVAAFMLGIGRVVGETMAVLMVAGGSSAIPASPMDSGRPMTATIASEMGEVSRASAHYGALFVIGALLFFITLAINLVIIKMTAGKKH